MPSPMQKNTGPLTARARTWKHLPKASTLTCTDCGKPAHDNDHYLGYGENWDKVQPVCRSCHMKRESRRRDRRRPVKNFVGPLCKDGKRLSHGARRAITNGRDFVEEAPKWGNRSPDLIGPRCKNRHFYSSVAQRDRLRYRAIRGKSVSEYEQEILERLYERSEG